MIRSQDAINIVSEIRGDQNVRNREDSNQSDYDSHTSHHGSTFIASVYVPVK